MLLPLLAAAALAAAGSPFDEEAGKAKASQGKDRAVHWGRAIGRWAPEDGKDKLVRAHKSLAHALLQLGEPLDAAEIIERGLRHAPDDLELLSNLGAAYLAAHRFDRAIAGYEAYLRRRPSDAAAKSSIAALLHLSGRTAEADRLAAGLCEQPEIGGFRPMCLLNRSGIHADLGRFREAFRDLEDAEKLDSARILNESAAGSSLSLMVRLQRGYAYFRQGDRFRARQTYEEALRESPRSALGWFHRGRLAAAEGKLDEAVADLTGCLNVDGEFVLALMERAGVHERAGRNAQARADYASACAKEFRPACAAAKRLKPRS